MSDQEERESAVGRRRQASSVRCRFPFSMLASHPFPSARGAGAGVGVGLVSGVPSAESRVPSSGLGVEAFFQCSALVREESSVFS